jgi:formamidopyrimidine-DNA glycosylase
MPELPEVTTTVNGLQRVLPRLKITAVWTDLSKAKVSRPDFLHTIKSARFFKNFQKIVVGAKVLKVERRAKNILIHLNNGYTILIHMKMTGHVMVGKYNYNKKENKWHVHKEEKNEALHDPYNRFVHFVMTLTSPRPSPSKGEGEIHMVLCDSRKFAKVTLIKTEGHSETIHLKGLGPEPLEKSFSFEKFEKALYKKKNGKIKITLMDPTVIAGIGNIYSDEMLWLAGIHPLSVVSKIPKNYLKSLYAGMKKVLQSGIDFGGDSMSDYRDVDGKRGKFQNKHNAYRKNKQKCSKHGCKGMIMKIVAGGRSAHFCNMHQKLF